MLFSYLKTAVRALRKRLGFTTINVVGLGLGIAAAIVIALYAGHELRYDRFHEQSDRIYQVYKERSTPTGTQVSRDTWVPMLPRLLQDYPSVETGTRYFTLSQWIEHDGTRTQQSVAYVDSTWRDVFTFPLKRGDAGTVLDDPNAVLVTSDAAERLFGDADPIGKTLAIDFDETATVAGVLAPIPTNSTLQFDVARAFPNLPGYEDQQDNWGGSFLSTFLLLKKDADPQALEAQFPQFIASVFGEEETERTDFGLQALPTLQNEVSDNRSIAYVLLVVALGVVLIAAINFTNLAVAQSLDRAREIGVRKALGARKTQLGIQFLGEAVLMSLGGLALGVLLTTSVLPSFNALYGVDLALGLLDAPTRAAGLLAFGVGLGLLAGAYPAWVLARFEPTETLRGDHETTATGQFLRRGLVVVQFAVSMVLIVGTLAGWQQINHLKNAPLNVAADQVLAIDTELSDFGGAEDARSRLNTFEREVERLSGVQSASFGGHAPGYASTSFLFIHPGDATTDDQRHRMRYAAVSDDYFATNGVEVVAGRTFSARRASDSTAVVLNRAAADALGWTDAVGREVRIGPDRMPVIGVVEDYRYEAARTTVEPVVHIHGLPLGSRYNYLTVRVTSSSPGATVDRIRELWASQVDPSRALPFAFVDQRFQQLYTREENLATVTGAFTGIAVVIACLGLLGLSALAVARRRKEISVRKVLGASVTRLATQLGVDYVRLVGLAVLLATPVAYLLLNRWLQDFAVRIDLGPGLFVGAGLCAIAIAIATVGLQTVRAALTDPVRNLRDE